MFRGWLRRLLVSLADRLCPATEARWSEGAAHRRLLASERETAMRLLGKLDELDCLAVAYLESEGPVTITVEGEDGMSMLELEDWERPTVAHLIDVLRHQLTTRLRSMGVEPDQEGPAVTVADRTKVTSASGAVADVSDEEEAYDMEALPAAAE